MSTKWAEQYIGIPYVNMGRSRKGVDCWGLVKLVYDEQTDITLPSYGDISGEDLLTLVRMTKEVTSAEPWHPVTDKPRKFDLAVMHHRREPIHVGLMASDRMVLHIDSDVTNSILVPLNSVMLRFRAVKIVRHRGLLHV